MSELSPKARAMLELAREGDGPLPGVSERLERKLALRIAAGAAVVTAATYFSKSASGATLALLKTAAVVGVGASISVVGYQALRAIPAEVPAASVAETRTLPAVASGDSTTSAAARLTEIYEQGKPEQRPEGTASAARTPAEQVSREPQRAELAGTRPPLGSKRAKPARSAPEPAREIPKISTGAFSPVTAGVGGEPSVSSVPSAPAPDRLGAEALIVRRIQQALRRGDGTSALRLLREAEQNFAGGMLQQERAAARVQALCLAGLAAAAREGAVLFERNWPTSPLLPRVRRSCR